MKKITKRILALAAEDSKSAYPMYTKLVEEIGELGEAINHREGYLPHKTMKEPLVGEIADVIQCAIALFGITHAHLPLDEQLGLLKTWLDVKTDKWESIAEIAARRYAIDNPIIVKMDGFE